MKQQQGRNSLVFMKNYPPKLAWYSSEEVFQDLVVLFQAANKRLLKKDADLFERQASERSICGALMLHLQSVLWGTPFCSYHIDVEYNRNRDGLIKTIIDRDEVVSNITCDLIVHSRGACVEQDNLIALEMKKANRKRAEKQKDKNRLIALTKQENSAWCYDGVTFPEHVCRYILGVYYEIGPHYDELYVEYYRQGTAVNRQRIHR